MPMTAVDRFALAQRWAGPLAERIQPLIRRAVRPPAVGNGLTACGWVRRFTRP
jgi:hypothetical protein